MSVNYVGSEFLSPYAYFSSASRSKMDVPVLPSQSLYAQFTYVRGVPSEDGGLSLDRLEIINSLLAQINAHRETSSSPVKLSDLDLSRPQKLIEDLSGKAWKMQNEASLPYKSWGSAQGLVFDVRA